MLPGEAVREAQCPHPNAMSASFPRPVAALAATLLAAVPASARAQQVLVRGRVLAAETGEPVAGANVVVRGTNPAVGTQADERGAFTLRVPGPNVTLSVSRIG